jgi:hypothetical protein
MTTKFKTIGFLTLGAAALAAQAQNAQPALASNAADSSAPKLSPTEQTIKDIKNPVSWMSWGADLRARNEYYNNDRSLSDKAAYHEQDYFRFRARVWTAIKPTDDLSLNVRLTTEPREYIEPSNSSNWRADHQNNSWRGGSGWDWTYGIFDQLNIQYKNMFTLPATLTVGRQDISLNDNWLTGDGTPLDGSWTTYMDSARLTYDLKEQQTTFDVIGIAQYARANEWLPTINEQNRALSDQDEKGAIFNASNKSIDWMNVDGYFIYKHDTRLRNLDRPTGTTGDDADIYTFGGRLSGVVEDNWKYSAGGAYQFGEKQDPRLVNDDFGSPNESRRIDAFGINTKGTYMFKDAMDNQVGMSYEYLTGDDPKTKKDEMFDVLWGRYPRWTDLYTFSLTPEARIAQYGNYHRFGPTWTLSPTKKFDISTSYFVLFSDQNTPTRATAANQKYFNGGNYRGQYLQSILKYKFTSHIAAMLQGELFFPGDYYTEHPMMSFVRAEVTFTF